MDYQKLIPKLKKAGVQFEDGLNAAEISAIESKFLFSFPPDLKDFLSIALPVNQEFINWRNGDPLEISKYMKWPLEGICFDIEHNDFWDNSWGVRPSELTRALEIAKLKVKEAPTLIPILGHRYIPTDPFLAGNPIFSVYQTDIIYYGCNLLNYFEIEFKLKGPNADYEIRFDNIRKVKFWSNLVESNG